MATFKCTALFEIATNPSGTTAGRRLAGWSESWLDTGEFSFVRRDWNTWCSLRAACLPDSGRIVGQRFQQIDPVGSSVSTGRQFLGLSQQKTDIPSVSLLCKIGVSDAPNVRQMILRGIPDINIKEGEYNPEPPFPANLVALANYTTGYKFFGRVLDAQQATIDNIDVNGVVTTTAAFPLTAPVYVTVLRTLDDNGRKIGGTFRVNTVGSTFAFTLVGWTGGITHGGKVRLALTSLFTVQGGLFVPVRAITKKVGRPSGGFVGKVSARR